MKLKQAPIPAQREDTLRQSMIALLRQNPLTAREISEQVGVAEREVYAHLEHIRQSLHRGETSLSVLPAECRGCGFVFTKRDRLKRPGRCPLCRGQSISQPRYLLE
ncbi:MAG: transcriptional regulator [Desulfuromonadales bacterium]|nr:transcriptional regulator [Desulfuromonadales bacterium]